VLRCIPRLDENRVRLEVSPAHMADGHALRDGSACPGEVGHLLSWRCHLRRHGLKPVNPMFANAAA
jgi:hypothetical protein